MDKASFSGLSNAEIIKMFQEDSDNITELCKMRVERDDEFTMAMICLAKHYSGKEYASENKEKIVEKMMYHTYNGRKFTFLDSYYVVNMMEEFPCIDEWKRRELEQEENMKKFRAERLKQEPVELMKQKEVLLREIERIDNRIESLKKIIEE
jgi:hypothetical protein